MDDNFIDDGDIQDYGPGIHDDMFAHDNPEISSMTHPANVSLDFENREKNEQKEAEREH